MIVISVQQSPVAKFIVSCWAIKSTMAQGCRTGPLHHPTVCSLTGWYDNPMHAQSTSSPQSGNFEFGPYSVPQTSRNRGSVPVINLFVAQDIALVCRIVFYFFILLVFLLTFLTHIRQLCNGYHMQKFAKSWCIHYINAI